jgi:hypothetical protein
MNLHRIFRSSLLCICLFFFATLITACGGSGGGTDGSGSVAASSGSVAVLLADGPLDDLYELNLTITKVSLLPPGNGREVVLYYDPYNKDPVNILQYRDRDHMFTLAQDVPAGRYKKIRLEVSDVKAIGAEGTCADLDIKLPSGRIDLNPRGGFEVVGGQTIAIRLDIDARKSIQLHQAGNSSKCIFRPVIFVDIDTVYAGERCPAVIKGSVQDFLYAAENSNTKTGFVLDLPGKRGTLDVIVNSETVLFDRNAAPGDIEDISEGDHVHVRGSLTPDGKLSASLVVVGDVLKLEGTVGEDASVDGFELNLNPGQSFIDSSIPVSLADETLILIGCSREVDASYIRADSRVTVIGKYSSEEQALLAVAVIIKAREITGNLETLSPIESDGDYRLEVRSAGDVLNEVILPAGEPIYLEGDGVVAFSQLDQLLSCGKTPAVRVFLDSSIPSPPTARKVWVVPEEIEGEVASIIGGIITLISGTTVEVEDGATVLRNSIPVGLASIEVGDRLTVFGLTACESSAADFFGYIVIIETE